MLSVFSTSKAKREYWKRRLVNYPCLGCSASRRKTKPSIIWPCHSFISYSILQLIFRPALYFLIHLTSSYFWWWRPPISVGLTAFSPWVYFHHTFTVRNWILSGLMGSQMTILSKSNYRFKLNVNMNIADSISFHFNFGKGHYFVLREKQHFFDKARFFFLKNRVNPAMVRWREKEVETCARRSLSF